VRETIEITIDRPAQKNHGRALSLVQRAYVLESGNVIMHGTSTELANNNQVQAAYLGI
jgi:branched-chain amino acid transport system ATP-binding protein